MEEICLFVMTICTIHNFCIEEDGRWDESDFLYDFDIEHEEEINKFVSYGNTHKDFKRKRNSIAMSICLSKWYTKQSI